MRTAVIGLGRMGRRHVRIARQCGLEIVALSDLDPAACASVASEYGLAPDRRFEDPCRMIDLVRPELLIVGTTAPGHAGLVRRGAAAGARAILCEKPMATSLADCDAMIEVCRRAGTRLAVNHQMRFMEQYAKPKALLRSAALGDLASVLVSAGNFGMAMNGTHYFEMFRYLTDEAPRRVAAWFSREQVPNRRGPQFADVAGSVRIATPSGKRLYLDCSADQGHGVLVTYACRNGRITVDELAGRMSVVCRRPEHRDLPTTSYGMPWMQEDLAIAPADAEAPTRSVLQALLAGAGYPTGEDGRLAMELLVGAHESAGRGGVTIDLDATPAPRDRTLPIA